MLDVALLGAGGYSLVDRPPINLLSTGRMDIEDSARRGSDETVAELKTPVARGDGSGGSSKGATSFGVRANR